MRTDDDAVRIGLGGVEREKGDAAGFLQESVDDSRGVDDRYSPFDARTGKMLLLKQAARLDKNTALRGDGAPCNTSRIPIRGIFRNRPPSRQGPLPSVPLHRNTGILEHLTETEREVLESLEGGYSPKEIAVRRYISIGTARKHIEHIREKLGIHSVNEIHKG